MELKRKYDDFVFTVDHDQRPTDYWITSSRRFAVDACLYLCEARAFSTFI